MSLNGIDASKPVRRWQAISRLIIRLLIALIVCLMLVLLFSHSGAISR